jgi:ectoine hydroxylase-related dioxygenase (phytanoyl-CoA dioxygenase family)
VSGAKISSAAERYRRDGYVVLPNAVPLQVLAAAEDVLDARELSWERELRRLPGGRSWISRAGEVTFTARLAGTEPVLRGLLASRALVELRTAIVGPSARVYFDQAVYKKAHCEHVVPWHQDNGYNPKDPADYVTFWIPVTDTTVANGTIRVQPGRHREGPRPHRRNPGGYLVCHDDAEGGVPVELHRGDVVAFSSLLPHATGPNTTPHVRKAYIASCVPDGTRLANGAACDDPVHQPLLVEAGV